MKYKLSDRIRPNSEAAPWVIEEVKGYENLLQEMLASIKQAHLELTYARGNKLGVVKNHVEKAISELSLFI
jgi:hypothetical protein